MDNTIGITTTVPIEVLMAAKCRPLDLNNLFIGSPDKEQLLGRAEQAGFPLNCCSWIKGVYAVCLERGIGRVLCVTTGDCSNTLMLMEVFKLRGLEVVPFAFPDRPDPQQMRYSLEALAEALGTTLAAAEEVRRELAPARAMTHELDRLTWEEGLVSGGENHLWLVSASDFNGGPSDYERRLVRLLSEARGRRPYPEETIRLAYIGVPPVFAPDLYPYLERQGARVVFNEVQRQFSMPQSFTRLVKDQPGHDLAEQYSYYTYPYSLQERLGDILPQLKRRRVDGVIHYVQAFCHRGIADIVFRSAIDRPVLTLEGNADFHLTHHSRTRLEAFLDVLKRRRTHQDQSQAEVSSGLKPG